MELRQYRRYLLACRVSFQWRTSDGSTGRGQGYTRDISTAGVFVITPEPAVLQGEVEFEVVLPPVREGMPGIHLRGGGYIVRLEQDGFAAIADLGFRIDERRSCEEREYQLC